MSGAERSRHAVAQLTSLARWWQLHQVRAYARASPTKLPVELRADVAGLGAAGDVVRVKPGFARNFLVPRRAAAVRRGKQAGSVGGLPPAAAAAAAAALAAPAARRRAPVAAAAALPPEDAAAKERRELEIAVKRLTTAKLTLRRKTGDDRRTLDAPLSAADVADAVARQLRVAIVPEMVDLGGERLATVGEYRLPLKLVLPDGARAALELSVLST